MDIEMLKKILEHKLDSGVPIVTCSNNKPHLAETWLSYVKLENDSTIYIPVAGMVKTENNLKENDEVILCFSNREIQGKMMPGTGVTVVGKGEILSCGDKFDEMKKEFDWIRAILKVEVKEATQIL